MASTGLGIEYGVGTGLFSLCLAMADWNVDSRDSRRSKISSTLSTEMAMRLRRLADFFHIASSETYLLSLPSSRYAHSELFASSHSVQTGCRPSHFLFLPGHQYMEHDPMINQRQYLFLQ